MLPFHKVKIRTADAPQGHGTVIEIDGVEVQGVTSVSFVHEVGGVASVELKFYAETVELEGSALVQELRA